MMWWWSELKGEDMSEDDFLDMLENGICSDFVERNIFWTVGGCCLDRLYGFLCNRVR